jgi:hypothetical protein
MMPMISFDFFLIKGKKGWGEVGWGGAEAKRDGFGLEWEE